jgi:uncharacterized protein (DUF885 family)
MTFRKYVAQMQPKLPALFIYIPGSPVTVEAMPDFPGGERHALSNGDAGWKTPRPDRRGGVSNFVQRSLVDDEATAYHEGIPGPSHAAIGRAADGRSAQVPPA